jgi:asparagine synthase (glutamine-hydrolysing)
MCGIVGILCLEENREIRKAIGGMANALAHRGPDGEGFFFDWRDRLEWTDFQRRSLTLPQEQGARGPWVAFGHRRLAVLDLSERGHQPMTNEDGTVWLIHNGEIYNYSEIRKELEARNHQFRSATDTEVIIHAYEEWGTSCLNHFNGMWAFAIWDSNRKLLFCSRDRAGVKPFYYTFDGKRLAFASEIKALLTLVGLAAMPNEQIIADYLFSGSLDHTEQTFFKNICQLRPGEYLLLEGKQLIVRSYWDIEGKEIRFVREEDYGERFYELLQDAIRLRLRSDVPIGTCLSGGLDSSAIVCLANKLIFDGQAINRELVGERQKTFSSCFENIAYDERSFIETVINQTGAEKNYVFPQPENVFEDLAQITWHQDEPFGSTSIYAQWNVMRAAKERGVTVLLDGQGADELLAGYTPSFYVLFAELLKGAHFGQFVKAIKGFKNRQGCFPSRERMFAALIPSWAKHWAWQVMKEGIEWSEEGFRKRYLRIFPRPEKFKDTLSNYLYQLFRFTSLPGLLHYEDRNSMAFSLETRLPFLDYRLVEYVFSLPVDQKIKEGVTKVVLRNALKGILPEEIRNRHDKMGFVTPEEIWFRTTLRNQIHQIINSKSFASRGYFDVRKVNEIFAEHCSEKRNWSLTIWRWVSLELWFRTFIDKKPSLECWKEYGDSN